MHFNTFALFMFSKVYNIKKEKGHNCKKGEFLFCFNFFSWQFLDYTNHANPSFSFFSQSVPANKKKTEGKAAKKVTGEKKSKSRTPDKVVTAGADDSDSDSSLDVEKWKKLLQQMTGESLNALFMGERVKDEVMKRILEK